MCYCTVNPLKEEQATFSTVRLSWFLFKVNCQRPTSVMRTPELKIPTLAKWLISPLVCVIIKICKSVLCSRPTAILIFIMKHEFLYNNSCKPVSLFSKVPNISKTLNNSGMKMIHTNSPSMALISWLELYLRLTEIFWSASLMQENSQSSDFTSSAGITAKI